MSLTPSEALALALDPTLILQAQGISTDAWQREFLLTHHSKHLLNCSRQAGKSTTAVALVVHTAVFQTPAVIQVLSPGQRQSGELFRKIKDG